MASWDITATQKYIGKYYELSEKPAQFAMLANTSKWFMPRKVQKKGKRYNFWAYTEPMTSVRRSTYANAIDNAFPTPQSDGVTILSYDTQDLTVFQNTIELNELLLQESQDALSIENLAERAIMAQNRDYAFQMNNAIWQDTACKMGESSGAYLADGSASYSGSDSTCYIKVDQGAISQFLPGMLIDLDGSTYTYDNAIVKDVFYGTDGPYDSSGAVGTPGPGLRIQMSAADISGGKGWGDLEDNSDIARSGEGAGENFNGFPSWFNPITSVYNDEDGSAITRTAAGNAWSVPNIFNYTSGGSAVVFDIAAHFTDMSNVLANRIHTGRASRDMNISRDEGVSLPGVLTAFGRPNLINEAVSTLDDSRRFTMQAAASLDEEQRKSYFGAVSFDGVVYHDPNLGAIALQADPASTANQLLVLDPQSWFYLTDSNNMKPTWVDDGAGKWTRMVNTNITMKRQAGTYLSCLLVCDQMPANSIIKGITSTATAV
jgi:hypothetical protein